MVSYSSRSVIAYHEAILAALPGQGQIDPAEMAERLDRTETEIWESIEWCSANGRIAYVRHDDGNVSVIRLEQPRLRRWSRSINADRSLPRTRVRLSSAPTEASQTPTGERARRQTTPWATEPSATENTEAPKTAAASTSLLSLQRSLTAPAPLTALSVCAAEIRSVCEQANPNTILSGSYPEAGR